MSAEDTVAVLMQPSAVFLWLRYVFSVSVLSFKAKHDQIIRLALYFLNAEVALVNGSDLVRW